MRTKTAFLSVVLLLISVASFTQNQEKSDVSSVKKNSIGIQFSPLTDGNQTFVSNLYSVRYGNKILKPLTIGTELSAYFYNKNADPKGQFYDPTFSLQDRFGISSNIFLRYSIRPDKRIQGFLEVSPYASFYFVKPFEFKDLDLFFYVAPGISLFSKNRKFSLDLYYKYSNQTFINRSHGLLSYKLNLHF
jgi:hypothetical protein